MDSDNSAMGAADNPAPVRLAVSEGAEENRTLLAIISAERKDDGTWALSGRGQEQSAIDRVRSSLEAYGAARKRERAISGGDPTAPPVMKELAEELIRQGFHVEELAGGDHEINFQLDMKTGAAIGTARAMQAFAAADSAIGRNVFEAIANTFSKASDELAVEINAELDKGDVEAALTALKGGADRGLFSLATTAGLLSALLRFDVSGMAREDRRQVRDARIAAAHRLGRFEAVSADAEAWLLEDANKLSPEQATGLNMVVALGAIRRGETETGLSILHGLVKEPTSLDAEGRGWAWRNITLALSQDDPKARHAAKMSADAFLEAGNKVEAGKSLMTLAGLLMQDSPAEAVDRLDEMIALLDKEGLLDRHVRAAALHARANRLAKMHRHPDAYHDACEAVELRRGLLGADEAFVSTLHLAALEACYVGDQAAADALEDEAERLTENLKLPHFQLAERVSKVAHEFDPNEADQILKDAEATNNLEVTVAVRVLKASRDASLSDTARLRILEETRNLVVKARGPSGMLTPVYSAMAQQLSKMEQFDRAESWFRKIIERNAHDNFASQGLVQCLWQQEKWGDAADFLRGQLTLRGDLPGMLLAFAKSLFEAGDVVAAIVAAGKVLSLEGVDDNIKKRSTELRERALPLLEGKSLPAQSPALKTGLVTRDEFEAALEDFARFISAEKRMRFWAKETKGQRDWSPAPEGMAQDLMHGFLRARFGDRVEIFPELNTGAGRVDLYLKFEGGLAILVELKMSGGRYSTPYAAAGEKQIHHYMDNRKTHLGYLVVLDGRAEKFGEKLLSVPHATHTVLEKLVDVRPVVKTA
jgi:tetratricopeptide (TPR) repeat protein